MVAAGPWLLLAGSLEFFGVPAEGKVIGRHEAVSIRGDRWRHDFVVSYQYQVADSPGATTASQAVDAALYDRLAVGSPVRVRYSPWAPVRALGSAGVSLEDASWSSRLPLESSDTLWLLEMEMYALVAVLGYLAYRLRSRPLTLVAVTAGASVAAGVLLFGFVIFPLLLLLWWRRPGRGFGWLLLASMTGSAVILAARVPWPPLAQVGANVRATAIVRDVRDVDRVWGNWRFPGQAVRQPFQIVDLEFAPSGSAETVHAVDRIDRASVPGLVRGSSVAVVYPSGRPHAARLDGGTRGYARNLFTYMVALTYGTGAALLLIGWPLLRLFGRLSGSLVLTSQRLESQLAGLSAEDPRRRMIEERLRALKDTEARRKPSPPAS